MIKDICLLITLHCFGLLCYAQEPTISLIATGDVLLTRPSIENSIKAYGEKYPFAKVAEYIKSADISACNFESCISTRGAAFKKEFTFRADPKRIECLKYAGFTITNLANNHSMDFGKEALVDTVKILRKNGFLTTGAGYNTEDANKAVLVEKNGIKIAFIGYSAVLPEAFFVGNNKPGVVPGYNEYYIKQAIQDWKPKSDLIIVFIHWGEEYTFTPNKFQRTMARTLINLGADAVIGHHPHVFQGIELYKNKPIVYSLGNFIFVPIREEAKETIITKFIMDKGGIKKIIINPVKIFNGQPQIVKGDTGKQILNKYVNLCDSLGTRTEVDENDVSAQVDTYQVKDATALAKSEITNIDKYRVVIDKPKFCLTLMDENNKIVKEYKVSVGMNTGNKKEAGDCRTPEGNFRITEIQNSSAWTYDFEDGKGPIVGAYGPCFLRLSSRWNSIGIHGTHDETTIGHNNSHGCIRLKNEDVVELKKYIQVGTPVKILTTKSLRGL